MNKKNDDAIVKAFTDIYKLDIRLGFFCIVAAMIATFFVIKSPGFIILSIVVYVLLYLKFRKDRKVKLLEDIEKYKNKPEETVKE